MKRFRTILCAFLIATLAIPLIAASAVNYGTENNPNEKVYSQTFSDVPTNHWAFKFIAELVERKAINGYPDGKFYPDNIVTRQEFAKIMVVAAGLTPNPVQTSSYADVPANNWASSFIEAASGYMTAYRNSTTGVMTYKPTAGALREDIAVAVVKLRGYDTRIADLSLLNTMFSDVGAISTAAQPYVALAIENEIISGYTDGTFRGQNTITRAEAAAILWRAFQYGNDEKVIGDDTVTLKPTASPKASPSPEPTTPSVPEKPYLADSLVRAKITDTKLLMTMDSNSNLIYYDADQKTILKLNPGTQRTETLLDAANVSYTVTTPAKDATSETTTIYTDLTVRQVFWDSVGSRLLIDGEFKSIKKDDSEEGWEPPQGGETTYRAIFILKGRELNLLGEYDQNYCIRCALDNGTFVVSYSLAYIYDISKGETVIDISRKDGYGRYPYFYSVIQSGRDIYGVCPEYCYEYDRLVMKYDYGTGHWVKVCEIPRYANAIHYQNGAFYTWLSTEIRATRPNGQNKVLLNPSTDIEVLDLLKLPSTPSNLFVTQDECFVFYDDVGKVIRMIYPNPDA